VTDLPPETRDLFYPSEPEPVDGGTRIGRDLEAEMLLLDSGKVVARLPDGPEYLVNTSLERFRLSLEVVGNARERWATGSGAEIDELKDALRRTDPEALADAHSYWAAIVEQIELEQF
jgi:hypothetical protein